MKRKRLCATRKGLAVMVAVAMMLSQSVVSFAAEETETVTADASSADDTKSADSVNVSKKDDKAAGVEASSSDGHTARVDVSGDVSAEVTITDSMSSGSADGVLATSYGEGSLTVVEVDGDVSAEASGEGWAPAKGINAFASDGGTVSVETGGITATNSDATAKGVDVSASGSGSMIDILVDGDIKTTGSSSYGISAESLDAGTQLDVMVNGSIHTATSEDGWAEGINISTDGKANVYVVGDLVSDGKGIMASDGYTNEPSEINIEVAGDLSAESAVEIIKTKDDSIMNITVDGIMKGEEHNIVLMGDSSADPPTDCSTENLSVKVWKIDTSKTNGKTAERVSYDESTYEPIYTDASDEAKDFIHYIIGVDSVETEGGDLEAEGDGTGKEGEKVYLKLTIPSGYSVDSFYNVEGSTKVDVVQDENGKYYLVVPRGGGVFVGVKLKETGSNPSGGDDSSSEEKHEHRSKASHRHSADSTTTTGNNTKGAENTGDQGAPQVTAGTGAPAEKTADVLTRVAAPQSIVVNGQEIPANVTIEANTDAVDQDFVTVLGQIMTAGINDFTGTAVSLPADAKIKESFSFTVGGMEAPGSMVQTVLTLDNYQPGDVLICAFLDANGNPVVMAITPEMVNGNQLLVTIPANCRIAIAG